MVHAITDANFQMPKPGIHAKAYLVYVALFATMTPTLRDRILRSISGQGFEDEDRISFIVYMFYLWPENGGAFLRAVLAGTALRD